MATPPQLEGDDLGGTSYRLTVTTLWRLQRGLLFRGLTANERGRHLLQTYICVVSPPMNRGGICYRPIVTTCWRLQRGLLFLGAVFRSHRQSTAVPLCSGASVGPFDV